MQRIFIHVGMMKTGTTYLQKHFYPLINSTDSDDYYYVSVDDEIFKAIHKVAKQNLSADELDKLKEQIRLNLAQIAQSNIIISYEGLIGETYKGFHNHKVIRDFLGDAFCNLSIILTIRRQDTMVKSLFIQTIHEGYSHEFDEFCNYENHEFRAFDSTANKSNIDIRSLSFYDFYQSYLNICDKNNILILPQELLLSEKEVFMDKLCNFLGIDYTNYEAAVNSITKKENRSYSQLSLNIAKRINKHKKSAPKKAASINTQSTTLYQKVKKRLRKMKRKYFTLRHVLQDFIDRIYYIEAKILSETHAKQILSIHDDGNKKLSNELSLDLDKFGYYSK